MPDENVAIGRATYVHVARRLACSESSVTLLDLAPVTLVVGGPDDAVGYLATGRFLDAWYAEDSGAATHTAAAVLSMLAPDRLPHTDARLLLRLPRIRGTGLEYQVALLLGELPETGGACILSISPPEPLATP